MRRHLWYGFISVVILLLCMTGIVCAAESEITVWVNGDKLMFDVQPFLDERYDRTMVPLRGIFEALGAKVEWDDATQTAFANKENTSLSIMINDDKLYKNGQAIALDAPA